MVNLARQFNNDINLGLRCRASIPRGFPPPKAEWPGVMRRDHQVDEKRHKGHSASAAPGLTARPRWPLITAGADNGGINRAATSTSNNVSWTIQVSTEKATTFASPCDEVSSSPVAGFCLLSINLPSRPRREGYKRPTHLASSLSVTSVTSRARLPISVSAVLFPNSVTFTSNFAA